MDMLTKLLIVFSFIALAACDSGHTISMTGLSLSPTSSYIAPDATQEYTLTASFSDNSQRTITGSAIWQSSDTDVATISNGTVTGMSEGDTTISASLNGFTASASLFVTSSTPTSLSLFTEDNSTFLASGSTTKLAAILAFENGPTYDVTFHATTGFTLSASECFTFDDTSAAIVASNNTHGECDGAMTSINATHEITSQLSSETTNSENDSMTLMTSADLFTTSSVTLPSISSMDVSPDSASLEIGDSTSFNGDYFNSNGDIKTLSWSINDTTVAKITSKSGFESFGIDTTAAVEALQAGTTTIKASAGGASDKATITVTDDDTTLSSTPSSLVLASNADAAGSLAITAFTAYGQAMDATTLDKLVFTSLNDEIIKVKDGNQLQTGMTGSTTLTATLGALSTSIPITVIDSEAMTEDLQYQELPESTTAASFITIDSGGLTGIDDDTSDNDSASAALSMKQGMRHTLGAYVQYDTGHRVNITHLANSYWSSDNAEIVTANDGTLIAHNAGSANITLTYHMSDGALIQDTLEVNVTATAPESLSINTTPDTVLAGVPAQLQAWLTFSDGDRIEISQHPHLIWNTETNETDCTDNVTIDYVNGEPVLSRGPCSLSLKASYVHDAITVLTDELGLISNIDDDMTLSLSYEGAEYTEASAQSIESATLSLPAGAIIHFHTTLMSEAGDLITLANDNIRFVVDDLEMANITANGVLELLKEGKINVTATYMPTFSGATSITDTLSIKVTDQALNGILLNTTSLEVDETSSTIMTDAQTENYYTGQSLSIQVMAEYASQTLDITANPHTHITVDDNTMARLINDNQLMLLKAGTVTVKAVYFSPDGQHKTTEQMLTIADN
ncbi:Ig-like domain-containing protein [uncultured Shewanella sp.]|uniref:Ig-like domain-containing protein n=1 Tax=uncultured Shewanella sp. TaxID=173975 RepID=UPI002630626B|nr:Ig-like domain-containing protein [uncultured Shewanella sp.]